MNDDASSSICTGPQRDRRNQRRITLWALAWGISYILVGQGIKREWLPFGVILAGVVASAILGVATVLAYRRFLQETDELRRKIEVDALAVAFGVGVVGSLTYWLLVASGAAPGTGFQYVFVAMIFAQPLGVVIGLRRYS